MTLEDLQAAVHDSLERGGWLQYLDDADEIAEMVDDVTEEIVDVCARFAPGTVLGRNRGFVFARSTTAA